MSKWRIVQEYIQIPDLREMPFRFFQSIVQGMGQFFGRLIGVLIWVIIAAIFVWVLSLIRENTTSFVVVVLTVALVAASIWIWWLNRDRKVARYAYKDHSNRQQHHVDSARHNLQKTSEELAALAHQYDSLRELCFSLWLEICATAVPADMAAAFKLKVSVEFTDPRSESLARQVSDLFVSRSWKTRDIEFRWRENPNPDYDIIIYSDHSNAGGLRGAFRYCKLLDDKSIGRMPREKPMEDHVTIVVFGPRGAPSDL